jgi:hypothetical protein
MNANYPARLDARLDEPLSRWLWLLKWLLALPHFVILAFLWLAVVPVTVVSGFAILFTGRYPRSLFDFTVGVMRWSWRVSYYGFSAFGTDRYPPFSLHSDPTYPADFTVDYPQRLSRGLVLVKWWLLALPHYVIVALFAGGWSGWNEHSRNVSLLAGGGLIGILVLVSAIVLLFTGGYPQPLYEFVMGMNRWCFRVLAYVALLRDEYPPFRLDQGGPDPGSTRPRRLPNPRRLPAHARDPLTNAPHRQRRMTCHSWSCGGSPRCSGAARSPSTRSTSRSTTASSWCWSGRRGAASPPCCGWWPGSRTSPRARSRSTATWSTTSARASATWPWCSRTTPCTRTTRSRRTSALA